MITRNDVFNRIATELRNEYGNENIYVVGERVYAPKQFPCVWVVEIESVPEERYTALDLSDEQRRSTFEIQVFSNKQDWASIEAEEIGAKVGALLRKMGYLCRTFEPIDNGMDANIKRHIGRYTRIIGGGDTLPQ